MERQRKISGEDLLSQPLGTPSKLLKVVEKVGLELRFDGDLQLFSVDEIKANVLITFGRLKTQPNSRKEASVDIVLRRGGSKRRNDIGCEIHWKKLSVKSEKQLMRAVIQQHTDGVSFLYAGENQLTFVEATAWRRRRGGRI